MDLFGELFQSNTKSATGLKASARCIGIRFTFAEVLDLWVYTHNLFLDPPETARYIRETSEIYVSTTPKLRIPRAHEAQGVPPTSEVVSYSQAHMLNDLVE